MERYFTDFYFNGKEHMQAACKAIESIYNVNVAEALELTIKRNIDDSPVFMRALHDMLLNEMCKQRDKQNQTAFLNAALACIPYMR